MLKYFSTLLSLIILFQANQSLSLPPCNGNFETHCFGIIVHKNGEKYTGEIKNFKYHGKGTYLFINGNIYEGEFKDGVQNGQGTFTFINGDRYEGEFKDGEFWNITEYDKNGNIIGKWINGEEQ